MYDVHKERLERVKDYLISKFNLKRIYLCILNDEQIEGFAKQSNETSLFFREPSYEMLISPNALNAMIQPVEGDNTVKIDPITEYKLFDVSTKDLMYHYDLGHIPSAVHLNTDELEFPPIWNRFNNTQLARVLLSYGIRPNNSEKIVIYGNPDPMAAFRVAIIMKNMGVNNIQVVNGGFQSW